MAPIKYNINYARRDYLNMYYPRESIRTVRIDYVYFKILHNASMQRHTFSIYLFISLNFSHAEFSNTF